MQLPKWLTDTGHFIGGILTVLASVPFPVPSAFLVILFLVYQLDESWHINDQAFFDIKTFMLGGFVGTIYLLASSVW